jgi:hypothetical protein
MVNSWNSDLRILTCTKRFILTGNTTRWSAFWKILHCSLISWKFNVDFLVHYCINFSYLNYKRIKAKRNKTGKNLNFPLTEIRYKILLQCLLWQYVQVLSKYKSILNIYGYFKGDAITDKCFNYYKEKYILHWSRKLLLARPSTFIPGSESRGTYDQTLLSHDYGSRKNLLVYYTKKSRF